MLHSGIHWINHYVLFHVEYSEWSGLWTRLAGRLAEFFLGSRMLREGLLRVGMGAGAGAREAKSPVSFLRGSHCGRASFGIDRYLGRRRVECCV